MAELKVPMRFERSASVDQAEIAEGAAALLRYTCEALGIEDLEGKDVLDVGCGTKFTAALLNNDLPIGSYTGVDVYREMVEWLNANVSDPRFEYHHVDVRNDLYNPDAPPMTPESDLGVGDKQFDIIWLFSVFTHLDPDDYVVMLRLLRRYIRPDGRLFFTVFIDELTEGGHGYIDWLNGVLGGPAELTSTEVHRENQRRQPAPFVDVDPERPLVVALYSRAHAYELIEGTGWTVLGLLDPTEHAQHQFICAPI